MKVDYFAEFRLSHITDSGNAGNRGTNPEKPDESNNLSADGAVPHHLERWGTGEQTGESVPHIPQPSVQAGNKPETEKLRPDQVVFESVPYVPQVPRKDIDDEKKLSVRNIVPDSRHPLISPEVRAKIDEIEADARAKGWPAELLWSCAYWDLPRGLAAVLDAGDEIGKVTPEYIEIWKLRRDRQRFMRRVS